MLPNLITDTTITFYDADYNDYQIVRDRLSEVTIQNIIDEINSDDPDIDWLISQVNIARGLAKTISGSTTAVPSGVEVSDNGVYVNGVEMDTSLTRRLLEVHRSGLPVEPFVLFLTNLLNNPSFSAQQELYDFLERANLPITPDGHFLAYKKVSESYKDMHTGKIDNSVGQVVEMPRSQVDDNRRNHCSQGLHFASKDYIRHFSGSRLMVLKINPADVVSIPDDYNFTKGRTWRYEVVGEIPLSTYDSHEFGFPYDDAYEPDDGDDGDKSNDDIQNIVAVFESAYAWLDEAEIALDLMVAWGDMSIAQAREIADLIEGEDAEAAAKKLISYGFSLDNLD